METDREKILYVESGSELPSVLGPLVSRGLSLSLKPTSLEDLFIVRVKSYEGK